MNGNGGKAGRLGCIRAHLAAGGHDVEAGADPRQLPQRLGGAPWRGRLRPAPQRLRERRAVRAFQADGAAHAGDRIDEEAEPFASHRLEAEVSVISGS